MSEEIHANIRLDSSISERIRERVYSINILKDIKIECDRDRIAIKLLNSKKYSKYYKIVDSMMKGLSHYLNTHFYDNITTVEILNFKNYHAIMIDYGWSRMERDSYDSMTDECMRYVDIVAWRLNEIIKNKYKRYDYIPDRELIKVKKHQITLPPEVKVKYNTEKLTMTISNKYIEYKDEIVKMFKTVRKETYEKEARIIADMNPEYHYEKVNIKIKVYNNNDTFSIVYDYSEYVKYQNKYYDAIGGEYIRSINVIMLRIAKILGITSE